MKLPSSLGENARFFYDPTFTATRPQRIPYPGKKALEQHFIYAFQQNRNIIGGYRQAPVRWNRLPA